MVEGECGRKKELSENKRNDDRNMMRETAVLCGDASLVLGNTDFS